jgi:hypothetical protein
MDHGRTSRKKSVKVANDGSILKSVLCFFDYEQTEKAIDIYSRSDAETAEVDE